MKNERMPKVRPLGLHTRGRSIKDVASKRVKVATLLGSYGVKSLASRAKLGSSKMLNPNFRREAKMFFIKYSKFDSGFKWIIYYIFFSPKSSPLDIVWSREVTLLLSTWAQFRLALRSLLGRKDRDHPSSLHTRK